MSASPPPPPEGANALERVDSLEQELTDELERFLQNEEFQEFLANHPQPEISLDFGDSTQEPTVFTFGQPSTSQASVPFQFHVAESMQMNLDTQDLIDDGNSANSSDPQTYSFTSQPFTSPEAATASFGPSSAEPLAAPTTSDMQQNYPPLPLTPLSAIDELISETPVMTDNIVSSHQGNEVSRQELDDNLENIRELRVQLLDAQSTNEKLEKQLAASDASEIINQQGQRIAQLELEVSTVKGKLADEMKNSASGAALGASTTSSLSRSPKSSLVSNRKWTDADRQEYANRSVKIAKEQKDKIIIELRTNLARYESGQNGALHTPVAVANSAKSSTVVASEAYILRLEKQLHEAQDSRDIAIKSENGSRTAVKRLEKQIEQYAADVAAGASRALTIKELEETIRQLEEKIRQLEKNGADMFAEGNKLVSQNEQMRAEKKTLLERQAELTDSIKQLKKEGADVDGLRTSTIQQLEEKIRQLERDAEKMLTEGNDLSAQNQRMKAEEKFYLERQADLTDTIERLNNGGVALKKPATRQIDIVEQMNTKVQVNVASEAEKVNIKEPYPIQNSSTLTTESPVISLGTPSTMSAAETPVKHKSGRTRFYRNEKRKALKLAKVAELAKGDKQAVQYQEGDSRLDAEVKCPENALRNQEGTLRDANQALADIQQHLRQVIAENTQLDEDVKIMQTHVNEQDARIQCLSDSFAITEQSLRADIQCLKHTLVTTEQSLKADIQHLNHTLVTTEQMYKAEKDLREELSLESSQSKLLLKEMADKFDSAVKENFHSKIWLTEMADKVDSEAKKMIQSRIDMENLMRKYESKLMGNDISNNVLRNRSGGSKSEAERIQVRDVSMEGEGTAGSKVSEDVEDPHSEDLIPLNHAVGFRYADEIEKIPITIIKQSSPDLGSEDKSFDPWALIKVLLLCLVVPVATYIVLIDPVALFCDWFMTLSGETREGVTWISFLFLVVPAVVYLGRPGPR